MSEPAPPPPVTAVDAAGRGLRIRFEWRGDRFGHVIERVDGEHATPEWSSIESESDAQWPDSPPLQQLSVETIGATTTALGVGAASRSHWSISVQPNQRDGAPTLEFDVAIRCGSEPDGFVGSRYRRLGGELTFLPLAEIAPTEFSETAAGIELRPAERQSKTTRWAYSIG